MPECWERDDLPRGGVARRVVCGRAGLASGTAAATEWRTCGRGEASVGMKPGSLWGAPGKGRVRHLGKSDAGGSPRRGREVGARAVRSRKVAGRVCGGAARRPK